MAYIFHLLTKNIVRQANIKTRLHCLLMDGSFTFSRKPTNLEQIAHHIVCSRFWTARLKAKISFNTWRLSDRLLLILHLRYFGSNNFTSFRVPYMQDLFLRECKRLRKKKWKTGSKNWIKILFLARIRWIIRRRNILTSGH